MLERFALPNARRLLAFVGYSAFFSFFFLMFSYWNFPYSRVRQFLINKVSTDFGYQMSIGDVAPHWVSGLHLSEVKVTKPAPDADSEPIDLVLEEATVRASLLPMLFGKMVFTFWASDGTGSVEGSYEQEQEAFAVQAELAELDLGAVGIGPWLGLPLRGIATGEVALTMPEAVAQADASGKLVITGVAIGDGKAKLKLPGLRDGFTVERLDAGTFTLELASENGLATIKQFESKGTDIAIHGEGTLRLVRPIARSRGDFLLSATFTDKYKERNDRTKALFQLLDFQPDLKRATSDDGTMTFRISGALSAIRAVPAATPAAESPARKTRTSRRNRGK